MATLVKRPRSSRKQKGEACYRDERECRDGEGGESWPKPQLEHRHVISCPALEDPERTALRDDERDSLAKQNAHRNPEPPITSPSDRAEPQVPETRQLSKPHTVVNHPESLGSAIEWGSAVHHDVSLAACVPRGQVPIGMFNTLLVNLVLLIG